MRTAQHVKFTLKMESWAWESAARALLFAALTGIGAIIRIPLSPVPVTMQVFFVLLSGLVLGPFWGMVSQIAYLVMGLCGAPFFAAPPHAGPLVLFGPTGGYLWGFVLAAGIAGWASRFRSTGPDSQGVLACFLPIVACLAGLAAVYICGASWLAVWLTLHGKDAALAFELGVKPFILIDLAKAVGATAASYLIPRRSLGV